tara:strand:- start:155 stop:760 length:606 start_codon:yes stop_codon:yes gene_type:complete
MNLIDKYLFGLGYEDNSELIEPGQKLQIKIPFEFDNKQINICPFIVPYYTKKSYLDVELKANLTDRIPQDELDFRMKCLIKNIQFDKPGRLGEMGWEAEYITDPSLFTASERARIAVSSFKKFRKLILKGDWLDGIKSQPGDIIVSHPLGIKFDQGFTEDSEKEGTFQRSVLSKKVFKFGEVKEDGMQYAIIGDDLDMHPI